MLLTQDLYLENAFYIDVKYKTEFWSLRTVDSRYYRHPQDQNFVSAIAKVRNSGSQLQSFLHNGGFIPCL